MTDHGRVEYVLTTKNTPSLALGIISVVMGALALLIAWIPFLGLAALPLAAIGVLLALLGFIIAIAKRFNGFGMPLLGGLVCAMAVVLTFASTGGTTFFAVNKLSQMAEGMGLQTANADLKPDGLGVHNGVSEQRSDEGMAAPQLDTETSAQERLERAEKNLYLFDQVKLNDVQTQYQLSPSNQVVPLVWFKVLNKGERSLDEVEVTIFFKDSNGTVLTKEVFSPVNFIDIPLFGAGAPLKPGVTWQMENQEPHIGEPVPSEWLEGSTDVQITDIRFSKSK